MTITLTSGNNQYQSPNTILRLPFTVLVATVGVPDAGQVVSFAVATYPTACTDYTLSSATGTTDSNGHATVYLALGKIPGVYTVTASLAGAVGSPVTFTATAESLFKEIHANFMSVIEGTIPGITTNRFKEAFGFHGVENYPNSNFDHTYHISPLQIPKFDLTMQGVADYEYVIQLQFGFTLSFNKDDEQFNSAVAEIEWFIKARLNPTTWSGTSIVLIEFLGTEDFPPKPNEQEQFAIITMRFRVAGRTYY